MPPLVLFGILVGWAAIMILLVQLATRAVTGSLPTLGSTIGTIVVTAMISGSAAWLFTIFKMDRTLSGVILCAGLSLLLQAMGYAATLKLKNDEPVSVSQGIGVILLQILMAVALGAVVGVVAMSMGYNVHAWAKLPGWAAQYSSGGTPAPTPQPAARPALSGTARLKVAVQIPTTYGKVTVPAGTAVQILRAEGDGYRARVAGAEMVLTTDQVSGIR